MTIQSARGSNADNSTTCATGVGGIFFKSPDPAKLATWYRDHLGVALKPGGEGANAPQYVIFEWRTKDHSDTLGATVFSIFPASSKYFDPTTAPFMMNFRVANLDRLLAQLKAEGVQVDAKMDDESMGRFGGRRVRGGRASSFGSPSNREQD